MSLPRKLLTLAVALLIPAAAQAAPPWSAPAAVPGTPDALSGLVFAPGGAGFTGWSTGGFAPENRYEVSGFDVTREGAAATPRKVSDGMLAAFFGAYGTDRLVAAGGTYGMRPRPLLAFGRIDGQLGKPRRLAGTRRGYASGLAVNARGDVAVILRLCPIRGSGCSRPTPYLVVRRAGRRITKPIPLAERGPAYAATVAINARGDALAVWDRPLRGTTGRRGVYTRIRTAGGRLSRTRRVGTSHPVPKLSAALGDDRTPVVGWLGQRISEGLPLTPAEIWISIRGGAQRVETVPNLGTGRYVGQAGVKVAIAAGGRPLAAWTGYEDERFVVRAAEVRPGAPVQVVSDPARHTVLADLATSDRGEAVVMGLTGIRGADPDTGPASVGVVASLLAPGAAAFGALESVADPKDFRETVDAEFVPGTGRVVAVWRDLGTRSLAISTRTPMP